jgi:hypothetical protein
VPSAADLLNDAQPAIRRSAMREERRLDDAYRAQLRSVGQQAARRFKTLAGMGLVASAEWTPPSVADVLAVKVRTARIRQAQRAMLTRVAGTLGGIPFDAATGTPGIGFDVTNPYPQHLLDQLGVRAAMLGDNLREPVAHAIAIGWAEGLSVPDTARRITAAVGEQIGGKAQMLARTDLNGLSNGGSQWAVQEVNAASAESGQPKPFRTKTWLSARDGRVRDTHQEADGQTVPVDQPYSVGGSSMSYPGDPAGPNQETCNCRCTETYGEEEQAAARPREERPDEQPAEPQAPPRVPFAQAFAAKGARWNAFPEVRDAVNEATAALDKVLGGMPTETQRRISAIFEKPELKPKVKINLDAQGQYTSIGGSPAEVAISAHGKTPALTMLHELGHLIDHTAFGRNVSWATLTSDVQGMQRVLGTIQLTDAYTTLRNVITTGRVQMWNGRSWGDVDATAATRDYTEYLLREKELFARAFAQWMAKHSPRAMKDLDDTLDLQRHPWLLDNNLPRHWEADDFAAVDEAITDLFRDAGLLADDALAGSGSLDAKVLPRAFATVDRGQPAPGLLLRQLLGARNGRDDLVVGEPLRAREHDVDHDHDRTVAAGNGPPTGVAFGDDDREGSMSATETETAADTTAGAAWVSDVAYEGLSTGDGRFIAEGALGWREPPLTLMAMVETPDFGGHAGAQVAGRMDRFDKVGVNLDGEKLPKGVLSVQSTGVFDVGDYGTEIERMVSDRVLTGISVDLAVNEWAFRDPETGDIIDPEEATDAQWEKAFMGEYEMAILDAEIMAATVCPTPAFADAKIALLASSRVHANRAWRANEQGAELLGVEVGQLMTTITGRIGEPRSALVAAPAAPIAPPRDWFFRQEPDSATPLTFTEDGEVYGHIAAFGSCHTGFINGAWSACVTPPVSRTGYAHFHVGEIVTAEGDAIPIGKLMIGEGGHASPSGSRNAARAHYDQTGRVGAYVRATDGQHGIWVCGALNTGLTDEQMRDLRANPPSGDWRAVDGNLELIAALAVPVPGYPVPRSQMALAASADGDLYVSALILTGGVETGPVGEQAEALALASEIEGGPDALHALIEG